MGRQLTTLAQLLSGAAGSIAFILLSACSPSADATERVAPAAEEDAGAAVLREWTSPIAEFLGIDYTDDDNSTYIAQEVDRLEWVTRCMAAEGFEYRYSDPAKQIQSWEPDPNEPEWGSRAWAEIYGFGISTQAFDQRTVGTDLVGYRSSGSGRTDEAFTDPNSEYLATLTEQESEAYYGALYGNDGYTWDETMTDEENDAAANEYFETMVPTGCESMSYEEVAGQDQYSRLYEDFGDELTDLYERIEAAPEIRAAVDAVSRCVGTKGFSYIDEQTTNDEIYQRLEPIFNMITYPAELATEEGAALSDAEMEELQAQPETMTEEGKALLAEIQQYEIDLAAAVYDCGYADLATLFPTVATRLEQEFLDAHRAELEAYRN